MGNTHLMKVEKYIDARNQFRLFVRIHIPGGTFTGWEADMRAVFFLSTNRSNVRGAPLFFPTYHVTKEWIHKFVFPSGMNYLEFPTQSWPRLIFEEAMAVLRVGDPLRDDRLQTLWWILCKFRYWWQMQVSLALGEGWGRRLDGYCRSRCTSFLRDKLQKYDYDDRRERFVRRPTPLRALSLPENPEPLRACTKKRRRPSSKCVRRLNRFMKDTMGALDDE